MDGTATVRAWGEGDRRWFLNSWWTIAVDGGTTGGTADVVTQELPAGYCPPDHRHVDRDEIMVVLRGAVDLSCGAQRWRLQPGGVAHIPRGVRHSLVVGLGGPAHLVVVSTPAGLGGLVGELGVAADTAEPPTASVPDLRALADAGCRHDFVLDAGLDAVPDPPGSSGWDER